MARKSLLFAVCLAAFIVRAIHAQEERNGIVSQASGETSDPSIRAVVPIGGLWTEFGFGETGSFATGCQPADPGGIGCAASSGMNSVFGGPPPWTFTAPEGGATLTVTDAFLLGDEFEIFDFGISIGSTSTPALSGSCESDPDPCLADPLVSHGSFPLDPGPHEITIQAKASPHGGGAAYFRVELTALDFYTVEPCRVVDTRLPDGPYGGPALASDQLRDFEIAGQCGVPGDAAAVSINITAINPTGAGSLRIFPAGDYEAVTSVLNFSAGQNRSGNGIIALSEGSLSVRSFVFPSPGTVHVVIDVTGYFQ